MSNDPTHSHVPQPEGQSPQRDVRAAAEQAMVERARRALEASPETIGPYRIIEKLGQGGMGEVYRAEQRVPIRRQVAIKLIKLGMDTKQVIARFEAERQALALMDHPHIAKVLDASTDDSGRPYFVMEYVKGIPINEYADKNQLTIQERLGLFGQVCHAIQHAHHKGVIHRDIKPSNVLTYTQDGKPHAKIIDFGIAKAIAQQLTDQTFYTLHSQFLGTPQYMSPEQAEGNLDIDTRTDVYSLGVMLYELLTGTTPFSIAELKAGAVDQIRKIICETEPPKPSTRLTIETATLTAIAAARRVEPTRLGALVRGELDWIVMMALDKDRRRRYDTPNDLADDIEAYLQGERVKAAPPSRVYLMQKFVRKNKGAVAIASILGTSLGVGLAGTSWQWFRADRNAQTAELSSSEAKAARQRAEDALQQAEKERALAIEQRDNAEFEAYVANLNFANGAVERGEFPEAQDYLKRCPEKHRGWEWQFLNEMARIVGTTSESNLLAIMDKNHEVAVQVLSANKVLLYFAPLVDAPVTVSLSNETQNLHGIRNVLLSVDKQTVYFEASVRDDDEYSIFLVNCNGESRVLCRLDKIGASDLISASSDGRYLLVKSWKTGFKVVEVGPEIVDRLTVERSGRDDCVIGFTTRFHGSNEGLLVAATDNIAFYEFGESASAPVELAMEDAKDYIGNNPTNFFVEDKASGGGSYEYTQYNNTNPVLLRSPNKHFRLVNGDEGFLEIWSVLTQSRLKVLQGVPRSRFTFSEDSGSLWQVDTEGNAVIYELLGHTAENVLAVTECMRIPPSATFLTSSTIDHEGVLWDRSGRMLSPNTSPDYEHKIVVVGDRFVEVAWSDISIATHVSHVNELLLRPVLHNGSNVVLQSMMKTQAEPSVGIDAFSNSEKWRRIILQPHGLRVESPLRSRRLTDIRIAWPANVTSIAVSTDESRLYAITSDQSIVCYDTRDRDDRMSWMERVWNERRFANEIVDSLWEGDVDFEDLESELKDVLPIERREAALQLLKTRKLIAEENAYAVFRESRFQFVGRKVDWQSECSNKYSESRIYRSKGPLEKLINDWQGRLNQSDMANFRDCVLRNEMSVSMRENLSTLAQAYTSAHYEHPNRGVTGFLHVYTPVHVYSVIALLRDGEYEGARASLDGVVAKNAAWGGAAENSLLMGALAQLSIYDRNLEKATQFIKEANELRNVCISQKHWNSAFEAYFVESSNLLKNAQISLGE